ncbi:amidohydrolase family protein [Pseudomonadota bacterium]
MSDRDAWLALTAEEAIEPELPICDPHHHLWDYPGSRYLLDEFVADIGGGHRIVKTVFVECRQFYRTAGPEDFRPVGETEYVDSVAGPAEAGTGVTEVADGIVGFADLSLGSAVQEILDAHLAASPRFRGVRHASAWDENDRVHNAHTNPPSGLLGEPSFRAGLACLEARGLSFDAWLYHPQIPELTDLARTFPGLTIVLDHMAGPLGIGPYADHREEVFRIWNGHMMELAACENVCVKLGGLTMSMAGFGWHKREAPPGSVELAQVTGPYYRACMEHFGAERSMFESNFPVDRASCSYTVQWNAFKRLSSAYSKAERSALFHDTAFRVYRLGQ